MPKEFSLQCMVRPRREKASKAAVAQITLFMVTASGLDVLQLLRLSFHALLSVDFEVEEGCFIRVEGGKVGYKDVDCAIARRGSLFGTPVGRYYYGHIDQRWFLNFKYRLLPYKVYKGIILY